jgi:hypothetical protein
VQGGQHHDRGPVLVVVEDGDVERRAEPVLDLEAARRGDVLEVDAAVHGRDRLDDAHDLVGVLGVEADRPRVDAGERLEQGRLALHDGQGGRRSDVTETEHRRAVRDDGDRVALDRQVPGVLRPLRQRQADPRHAGGVGHREVVPGPQRHRRDHLELAVQVDEERPVAPVVDVHVVERLDRGEDPLRLAGVAGVGGDVEHQRIPAGSTTSIAITAPPASPIAEATRPNAR